MIAYLTRTNKNTTSSRSKSHTRKDSSGGWIGLVRVMNFRRVVQESESDDGRDTVKSQGALVIGTVRKGAEVAIRYGGAWEVWRFTSIRSLSGKMSRVNLEKRENARLVEA